MKNIDFILKNIKVQADIDDLAALLESKTKKTAHEAAEVLYHMSLKNPQYLFKHKKDILRFAQNNKNALQQYHCISIIAKLPLTEKELGFVWDFLTQTAGQNQNSKIVRVNCLQTLYDLLPKYPELKQDFWQTIELAKQSGIPSMVARIKKFKKS